MGEFTLQTTPGRSRIMAAIRSHGNASTEGRLLTILRRERISGWRRRIKLPGSPDFVFPAHRVAVFVDGCFWHGCPQCYREPRRNKLFWRAKIARNVARDSRVTRELRSAGWRVVRIREHSLKSEKTVATRIRKALEKGGRLKQ